MVINQTSGTIVITEGIYSEKDIAEIQTIVNKVKGRKLIIVSSKKEEESYK